jgi:hypothetical protein
MMTVMVSMPVGVAVVMAVMMVVTIVRDDHDGAPDNYRARIRVDVNDPGNVRHYGSANRSANLTTAIARMRLIHGHANECASRRADDRAFGPAIVVVTANQSPRHRADDGRFANDGRPINFSLRRTDSNRRERESEE